MVNISNNFAFMNYIFLRYRFIFIFLRYILYLHVIPYRSILQFPITIQNFVLFELLTILT